MRAVRFLERLAMEPPFRVFVWALFHVIPPSAKTRARWTVSKKPAYLLGVVTAAEEAIKQGLRQISVIEFGVAGGAGLLALQKKRPPWKRNLESR